MIEAFPSVYYDKEGDYVVIEFDEPPTPNEDGDCFVEVLQEQLLFGEVNESGLDNEPEIYIVEGSPDHMTQDEFVKEVKEALVNMKG